MFSGKHVSNLFINSKPLGWISKVKPSLRLEFNAKISIAHTPYSTHVLLKAFEFSVVRACYSAHTLLRPILQTKSKRELGGMAMCVRERDREKVGDGREERVRDGREEVRKSRGGRESIGWEREEV